MYEYVATFDKNSIGSSPEGIQSSVGIIQAAVLRQYTSNHSAWFVTINYQYQVVIFEFGFVLQQNIKVLDT
jgi:hypothetical protein